MSKAKREAMLIQLMRDVCEEVGLPEEKQERAPILEALNVAFNKGAESAQPAERGPCLNCQAPFSAHPLKKHAILAWIRPCAGGRTDYFEADPPPPQPKGKS